MPNKKFSFQKGMLWGCILVFILVGGNTLLFRYLIKKSGGKEQTLSLFSLREKTGTVPLPAVSKVKKPTSRIAIVIDDLGYRDGISHKLARISKEITLSILPHLSYSKKIAKQAMKNHQEILLHLPMEPVDSNKIPDNQTGMLLNKMSSSQIQSLLQRQLQEIPSSVGINNHMGSLFTSDKQSMRAFFAELKKHKLFFLDSLTISQSVAYDTARELGIPALRRDIFLDNRLEKDYILNQLKKLSETARRDGQAIAIGHPFPVTLEALGDFVPQLKKQGIELTRLSNLLD